MKSKTKKKTKKSVKTKINSIFKMYPIAILALIDTIMVLIPSYFENYIPNINQFINMEQAQYTYGLAYYGIFSIIMNLAGAYIGGKFKGRYLIITSLCCQVVIGIWYGSLMFQEKTDGLAQMYQWIAILFLYAFAISGLIWGPLWRIIKNYNTETLVGKEKEKLVGKNNGIAGTFQGMFGFIIGVIATILFVLTNTGVIPNVQIGNNYVTVSFLILISLTILLTISATILTLILVKPIENQGSNSFSFKSMLSVMKNWKIWCLGFVIIGVFMLQLELSAYMNYLSNIFLVSVGVVTAFGIIRTYVLRFLLAGWAGKRADQSHSYIFILTFGLLIGIIFIIFAIFLPGIGGDDNLSNISPSLLIFLQILAILNLLFLGSLTWILVTIRWSPIGTELGINNDNYASAIAFLSALGFSPGLYFKFIKSYIEKNYTMEIWNPVQGKMIVVANKTGNQLILLTCASIAFVGFIAGVILYIYLYRGSSKYAFRRIARINSNLS